MRPLRNCECCSTVPQEQLGDTTNFFCGRDVLAAVREWRVAHPRAALSSSMCFPNDVTSMGGMRCRGEGGEVCQGEANPCLIYTITAAFFEANIPFLVSNKVIKKKVEALVEEERKVARNRLKNSAAEVARRAAHQADLNKTFSILREDARDLIDLCPVR